MKDFLKMLTEMLSSPLDYCLWALAWAFAGMLITLVFIL